MSELRYTATHEWCRVDGDEIVIGITEHAQELLGDMVFVEMPEIGKSLTKGAEFGVVESVKAASDVYAPVSGVVSAINSEASANPAIVNEDPQGSGWLIKIKPTSLDEFNELLNEAAYQAEVAKGH